MIQPHCIVFANEKGGTGKSTTAVHTAIALAASGHRVAALDLDSRQRTMTRYLENRDATMRRLDTELPKARYEVLEEQTPEGLDAAIGRLSEDCDVLVIDTPGRDDPVARSAILKADTLVTPMNDSFVDLDLIGQVHPENYKITRPSFYAELIWTSRTQRAKHTGKSVDWVVLRNRLQHIESHNLRRVGATLRLRDKGHVAGVEGAHCRHKRKRAAVAPESRRRLSELCSRTDRLHRRRP